MKNLILVIVLFASFEILAQEKYLIFFKDKGISENTALSKTSEHYNKALSILSSRAIDRRSKVMQNNALITYEDLPINESYVSQLETMNINIHHKLKWFNAVSAYITDEQLALVKSLGFVSKVERVKVFREKQDVKPQESKLNKTTLDYGPSYNQYALSGVPSLHDRGINGEGIIIGLLDSGFDWKDHESFTEIKVLAEYDFVFDDAVTYNEEEDVETQHNHGTSVLSIIGGYKEGQIIGPSYKAFFLLAKTEDVRSEKHVEEDNYAAALEWMESMGVDITSSSLGYSNEFDEGEGDYTWEDMDGKTTIVTRAAELAFHRGVLTISSAGNEGNKVFRYISAPSDGFNTISVGAVNSENEVAGFSSRGPSFDGRIKPDVVALGVQVYNASANGFSSYGYSSGTSLAAPIVGGIAGQILSAFPYLSNVELRRILHESSDTYNNPDTARGYGLLSAPVALSVYYPQIVNASTISKRLYAEKGIKPGSVVLHYTTSGDTNNVILSSSDNQNYSYFFPDLTDTSTVEFSYSFRDMEGHTYQEPANGKTYIYNYGNNWIAYKTLFAPSHDYSLSNNYPNPFNYDTKTYIRFTAKGGERADLIIVDGIGQKVKTLFSGYAKPGVNEYIWDGFTDNDEPCASGVYFYFLKIGDKDFGNKMLLLK